GMDIVLSCPKGYKPDAEILERARRESKNNIQLIDDPLEAASTADVLYTDVWVSMGQEEDTKKRIKVFKQYQINKKLLARARPDAIVMHCLPAHRGEEITDEVIDGPHSVVFDQAENRLHTQKALLEMLIK
ncbi:MAG TPA: ornithine carbamoyltransferase, partial [Nitrospiraceae bacterium]|nr:ornithine carbamoyltransferase [Nitrospiraceae bacterium]